MYICISRVVATIKNLIESRNDKDDDLLICGYFFLMSLNIKEEFKNLIPPLTKEEFKQLESNCMAEGIREPILTWRGFIIDGHNRYEIAKRWDLDYTTKEKQFKDESEVKEWMILNQFGRRNLSNYQRSVLALQLENVFKEKAKENQGIRTDILQKSAESLKPIDTRKELAKVANVSHDKFKTTILYNLEPLKL